MRENWNRSTPTLDLSNDELTALIGPAFPGKTVQESELTQGGLANTNIRIKLSGSEHSLLLRLFTRDSQQAEKEYRINKLVERIVPTPQVLHFALDNPVTGHPYLIREWIDGERLEQVAFDVLPEAIEEIAYSVGFVLASIHSVGFAQSGFLDGQLNISHPINIGSLGLIEFARQCLIEGIGGERLGVDLVNEVMEFLSHNSSLLDQWTGAACLTHSDFGGSNILIGSSKSHYGVVAVLDWEFAFAGSPFFDIGNLLRKPLGALPKFEHTFSKGYQAAGGALPSDWRKMSLLADLTAWFDFLVRPNCGDELITDARKVIVETMNAFPCFIDRP